MTQKEFEILCRQWQEILRLQDWIIKPMLVEASELPSDIWGDSQVCSFDCSARVRASTDKDRDPDLYRRAHIPSTEETLVHELLEVLMSPMLLDVKGVNDQLKEVAINKLAYALMQLKGQQ